MSYLSAYSLSAYHGLFAYNLSLYHDLSGKRWKLRRLLFNDQLYTIIFQENWYPNINEDNYQSPVRQKLEISKVKYNSTALKIKVHVSPLPVFTFTELHCGHAPLSFIMVMVWSGCWSSGCTFSWLVSRETVPGPCIETDTLCGPMCPDTLLSLCDFCTWTLYTFKFWRSPGASNRGWSAVACW